MSFDVLGVHISSEFVGGLFLPSLVFVAVAVWPFIDRAEKPEHFTRNYLDRPFPTAVGILGVTLVMVASIAGMDVIVAEILGTSTAVLRPYLIAALVLVPAAAGTLTYAILGGFEDGSGAGGEEATTDDRPSSATEDRAMTESSTFRLAELSPRRYRWADRATKLAGVGLIAVGLDAGGGTPAGVAFAALGVALGLATVLIEKQ